MTKHEAGHSSEGEIDRGWFESRSNEVISRLNNGDRLEDILNSFPDFKEYFRELDTIDCSDGRVLDGKKIGLAGSGILLSPEDRVSLIARLKGKIKLITTHTDCGAAALKFKSLNSEEIPAGITSSDEYGSWRGRELAEALGCEHKYIEMEQMASEYHNEVALVLDGTGEFDSTNLPGFPAHFVCTGAGLGLSPEYLRSEVEILTGIALGDHGFGSRFDATNPFYIMVAAKDESDLKRWEEIAQQASEKYSNRVEIKGFIQPEK